MIAKTIGLRSAEVIAETAGNPNARSLRIVPMNGGELFLSLTGAEMRRLADVLTQAMCSPEIESLCK